MASVVAKSGQLKPELRLAAAVSNFERQLTQDQKAKLQEYKSQSRKTVPTIHDVMRFTAEIKDEVSRRGGRCLSTRLVNILQAAQQFAALGDIVVGGSQNILCCSVWGLLRMTLFSLVSITSYVEKLTDFLMIIGRSAPCFENLVLLYPRSKNLQSYLVEYFIVVVELCQQLLKLTKQSILQQITSFWNPSDLDPYKTRLDAWGYAIRMEVDLLMHRNIQNQGGRLKALTKFSKYEAHLQKQHAFHRVLDACSTYDHQTPWKEIRLVGNTSLFQEYPEYSDWKDQGSAQTLVCTGRLGSGKSVWMANIIDDLNLKKKEGRPLAYFFCRHDIAESLKARTVIGSLSRQILGSLTNTDFISIEQLIDKTVPGLNSDVLLLLLHKALPADFSFYFVLDGLDECDEGEKKAILYQLQRLQKGFGARICLSLRIEADTTAKLSADFGTHVIMSIPEENPDIESFIGAELEKSQQAGKLKIGDANLVTEIKDALILGSQGMFLWVVLQIETLCNSKTDEAIRTALEDLPRSLPETYHRIIEKSGERGKDYQMKIFELILAARQPLTMDELREALSVVPGDDVWDQSRQLNDIYDALACCGCIIFVDEEKLTVRLLHHSVKQFLLGEFSDSSGAIVTAMKAEETMAAIIVTYLNYSIFKTQISTKVVPKVMAEEMPDKVIRSVLPPGAARTLSMRRWKSRNPSNINIAPVLAERHDQFRMPTKNEMKLYPYAKAFWQRHARVISPDEQSIFVLLKNLLDTETTGSDEDKHLQELYIGTIYAGNLVLFNYLTERGARLPANCTINDQTALFYALDHSILAIAEALITLISDKSHLLKSDDASGMTPLIRAAEGGYVRIVEMLVQSDVDLEKVDTKRGITALLWAVKNGHRSTVRLLCHQGADVNFESPTHQTALNIAAESGDVEIASVLVDYGAKLGSWTNIYEAPLITAVRAGKFEMVCFLIEAGANLELCDDSGDTALFVAVRSRKTRIVKLLIGSGANVEARDLSMKTPLTVAAEMGFDDIVSTVVRSSGEKLSRAIVNASLLAAVGHGHQPTVEVLLDEGADIESPSDMTGWGCLSVAAAAGHEQLVRCLLDRGAKTDNTVYPGGFLNKGCMPLNAAAENGHIEIVKLLLSRGARIQVHGCPTLAGAARGGHLEVVRLLIERGVDLEAQYLSTYLIENPWPAIDGFEKQKLNLVEINEATFGSRRVSLPALSWAALYGHKETVELLLASGADVRNGGRLYQPNQPHTTSKNDEDRLLDYFPLACAAMFGHVEVVKLLLNHEDKLGIGHDFDSAIRKAAGNGKYDVTQLLMNERDAHLGIGNTETDPGILMLHKIGRLC